jgi:hypothetical protein
VRAASDALSILFMVALWGLAFSGLPFQIQI